MSKKVPLTDVFDGYCEYTQCIHNFQETCDYGGYINEYMEYKKGNDFATCNGFKVKEGYCEECGSKLKEHVERHPYGDTVAIEMLYECPNCD